MRLMAWIGGMALAAGVATAASAASSDALVSADWLEQNLANPDVRVFEVSVDTGVYERGHIPGAVHLNWHTDLVDTVRRDIVARDVFQEKLREVPGAKNFPWGKAVNEDGTFKSEEELKALFAEAGIDGSKPIITYCRIGERSSHTWYALSKILGYDVRNYDGSWTEYGNAVGVPIANLSGTVWTGK